MNGRNVMKTLKTCTTERLQSKFIHTIPRTIISEEAAKMKPVKKFKYVSLPPFDLSKAYKNEMTDEVLENYPEDIKRIFSLVNGNKKDILKYQITKAIKLFERFPGDTGSSEVQIAVLTQKILFATEHIKKHKQDKHSERGLVGLVTKRRKLMDYLRKKDFQKFKAVATALDIRYHK